MKKDRRWHALIRRVPKDRPSVGVEIGVFCANTAVEVLQACSHTTYWLVDPWEPYVERDVFGKCTRTGTMMDSKSKVDAIFTEVQRKVKPYGSRVRIFRGKSLDAAEILPGSLDYVFIDGIHTYEAVSKDIAAWLPKIKAGGWLGGHDYDNLPRFPGVRCAVNEAFPDGNIELDVDHTWWRRTLPKEVR